MNKIWIAEGKIISTPSSENLCRTQAEIRLFNSSVKDLLCSPLGNHLLMVSGKCSAQLKEFQELYISSKST